jgi:hypothetical protein
MLFFGLLVLTTQTRAQDYIRIPGGSPHQSPITVYYQSQGCDAQDQVPSALIFYDIPESLLKTHFVNIEWTPALKGRWERSAQKTWTWTRTSKLKPLQSYQSKISLRKRPNLPIPSDTIVQNYKSTLTFCLIEMEPLSRNLVRLKFDANLEMEGKDLAPFVTFSLAGKTKKARWTTVQGFQQAAAELELLDAELSETLDITIPKTIRLADQSIRLPKAYFVRFDLGTLAALRKAARVRVPASELSSTKGFKETCEKQFDLIDMADPKTCFYDGEAFIGGNHPEAMSRLTAAQCKKGRAVIDRYVQCVSVDDLVYSLLWDESR